jgi:hypothetical protein
MNLSVAQMLETPGFYQVSTPAMLLMGRYSVVEVEPDGTCHQLKPDGTRDGVLPADGWYPGVIVVRKVDTP